MIIFCCMALRAIDKFMVTNPEVTFQFVLSTLLDFKGYQLFRAINKRQRFLRLLEQSAICYLSIISPLFLPSAAREDYCIDLNSKIAILSSSL